MEAALEALTPVGNTMIISLAVIGGTYAAVCTLREALYYVRRKTCTIDGHCPTNEFDDVLRAIMANVGEGREDGCQVAVTRNGELVVDLAVTAGWPGWRWKMKRDSLLCVFSSGKVLESLVMALADDQGWLRLSEHVHRVWPGFASGDAHVKRNAKGKRFDKREVKVCDIMAHRAGLALVDPPIEFSRIAGFHEPLSPGAETLREILAAQPIRYFKSEAERETLYMATTRGAYLSVLLHLRDPKRRSFNNLMREEVLAKINSARGDAPLVEAYCPLPAHLNERVIPKSTGGVGWVIARAILQLLVPRTVLEVFIDRERLITPEEGRVARVFFTSPFVNAARDWLKADGVHTPEAPLHEESFMDRILNAIVPGRKPSRAFVASMNSDAVRNGIGNTSYNCYSNARSLARIASAFVTTNTINQSHPESSILTAAAIQRATASAGVNFDEGLGREFEYSDAGFGLDVGNFNRNNSCKSLKGWHGWYGLCGSCVLFNFELNMTFSYVPTRFEGRPERFRARRLLKAVVAAEARTRHAKLIARSRRDKNFMKEYMHAASGITHRRSAPATANEHEQICM